MSEEQFYDLAVIAMHYSGRFEVDREICQAFVKAHPRRLFQALSVAKKKRERETTIVVVL